MYIIVVNESMKMATVLCLGDMNFELSTGSHLNVEKLAVMKNSKFACLSIPGRPSKHLPLELTLSNLQDTDDVYKAFPRDSAVFLTSCGYATLTPLLAYEFGMDCERVLPVYTAKVTKIVPENIFK